MIGLTKQTPKNLNQFFQLLFRKRQQYKDKDAGVQIGSVDYLSEPAGTPKKVPFFYTQNMEIGFICDESLLFKQHYLWQYVQLLHNR